MRRKKYAKNMTNNGTPRPNTATIHIPDLLIQPCSLTLN